MEDKYFDKYAPIYETKGNLPHWNQCGKIAFITFRLADSIPNDIIRKFIQEASEWREEHPNPVNKEMELWMIERCNRMEKYLDSGMGECILKHLHIRDIIVKSLLYMETNNYISIHSYVIMPNHIHLLLEPLGEWTIQKIMRSLKMHTSKEINNVLQRTGTLWRKEYFDRIIRSERHYLAVLDYIRDNPRKCRIGTYTYYLAEELQGIYK